MGVAARTPVALATGLGVRGAWVGSFSVGAAILSVFIFCGVDPKIGRGLYTGGALGVAGLLGVVGAMCAPGVGGRMAKVFGFVK